jgi:alpha-tubulin suppressor-like RCC1 family protein
MWPELRLPTLSPPGPPAISTSSACRIQAWSWPKTEGSAVITATADGVSGTAQLSVALPLTEISAGSFTACGLKPSGAAYCWGLNAGTGTTDLFPVAVPVGLTFSHISAGDLHVCGVTTAGAAYCWGDNSIGQPGAGMTPSATCRLTQLVRVEACPTPVPVAGGLTFATLSAGGAHTCGILVSGEAFCWGHN